MGLKFDREPYEPMAIDMTPMVDAIFAIILFLLVSTQFIDSLEQDLSIQLPTQSREMKKKEAPPTRPIVVNVRYMPGGKATYNVENELQSISTLTANLSRAKVRNRDQEIIIRGDRNVKWEHVAAVMGACASAGITKVSATVELKEGG